jgi:hypothetical protein
VLKQNHTAQRSANDGFVTMLSGAAYRLDLRVIVGVVMQRGLWEAAKKNGFYAYCFNRLRQAMIWTKPFSVRLRV